MDTSTNKVTFIHHSYTFIDQESYRDHFGFIIPEAVINIAEAAKVFYYLVYVDQPNCDIKLTGSERRQFLRLKQSYLEKLSEAMFDYLLLIICGELRWAGQKTKYVDINYKEIPLPIERKDALNKAIYFSSKSIILNGLKIFKLQWENSFGGKSWYRIVKAASRFGKVSNEYFIDSVFNARHNGGILFDRNTIFLDESNCAIDFYHCVNHSCAGLQSFLNCRREKNFKFTEEFNYILSKYLDTITNVLNYKKIIWGTEKLRFNLNRMKTIDCCMCQNGFNQTEDGLFVIKNFDDSTKDRWRVLYFICKYCLEPRRGLFKVVKIKRSGLI